VARRAPVDRTLATRKLLAAARGARLCYGGAIHVEGRTVIPVARVRAAGGIIFAKTNTPAYGHKDMCDNLLGPLEVLQAMFSDIQQPAGIGKNPTHLADRRLALAEVTEHHHAAQHQRGGIHLVQPGVFRS